MKLSELKALRDAAPTGWRKCGKYSVEADHPSGLRQATIITVTWPAGTYQEQRLATRDLAAAAPEAVDMACELADALDELLDAGWPGRCLAEDTARDTARALLASIGYTEASDEATP